MTKEQLLAKLTSRKFWAMIASIVASIMTYNGADSGTVESIVSLIGIIGSPIIYMIIEGSVDKKNVGSIFDSILNTVIEIINSKNTTPTVTTNTTETNTDSNK